jgi:hypothetical protein
MGLFESQIAKAMEEGKVKEEGRLPNSNEIEVFAQNASEALYRLNFESKKAIIRSIIDKVVGNKQELQVYGYLPVNNINVFSINRNCRITKRREIDPF